MNDAAFQDAGLRLYTPKSPMAGLLVLKEDREDVDHDSLLQPGEMAVLWGLPDDNAALWIDAKGAFMSRMIAAQSDLKAAQENVSRQLNSVLQTLQIGRAHV